MARKFVLKVCRNGNSLTLQLPAAVAEFLNINRGDLYTLALVGKNLVYTPMQSLVEQTQRAGVDEFVAATSDQAK